MAFENIEPDETVLRKFYGCQQEPSKVSFLKPHRLKIFLSEQLS